MPTMTAPAKFRKPARPTHGTCRLSLSINGVTYGVKPNHGADVRSFRLRKSDGTVYDVAQAEHGPTCDCPDFIFHRDGIDADGCKHIKAMVACGLMSR